MVFFHHKKIAILKNVFRVKFFQFCFVKTIQKRFCLNFVIITLTFWISYKFFKCLAGRITYSRAGSILSASRIPFKFKNDLGAGRFHSASRIRPAGRTLPTLSLVYNLFYIKSLNWCKITIKKSCLVYNKILIYLWVDCTTKPLAITVWN